VGHPSSSTVGVLAYGYIYDAEGGRVARGTITAAAWGQQPSCNVATNGFRLLESYVLGQGGEELTTLDGNSNPERTNVYGAGKLLATYDSGGLHFHLADPLGSRRVQTTAQGEPEEACQNLPFGDGLVCNGTDATPLHFTGKERDTESGNDYFGARYYASSMGRFLSPDWSATAEPVPYAKLTSPQSLNLYAYAGNNPLGNVDVDGHNWKSNFLNAFFAAMSDIADDQEQINEQEKHQAPAQQQKTLPENPSGLGEGWKDVTPQGGTNPKIPKRYRGPKGSEIEFDPANPDKSPKTWGGRDHWHEVGPDGKREDGHLAPGSPIPGPDGAPTESRSMMDRMRSVTPGPILKLGTAGVIIYIIIDEGSRLYPPRNLVPVP
jgi:RHS repeat-associated protein